MVDYSDVIETLFEIPHSQFWICESTLCAQLGFTFEREDDTMLPEEAGTLFPDRSLLTRFLWNLKLGKATIGPAKLGVIDVASTAHNSLYLYCQLHNQITQWKANGDQATNKRRIFCIYTKKISTKYMVNFTTQLSFVKVLVGEKESKNVPSLERDEMARLLPFFIHYPASKQSDEFTKHLECVIAMKCFQDLAIKLGWGTVDMKIVAANAREAIIYSGYLPQCPPRSEAIVSVATSTRSQQERNIPIQTIPVVSLFSPTRKEKRQDATNLNTPVSEPCATTIVSPEESGTSAKKKRSQYTFLTRQAMEEIAERDLKEFATLEYGIWKENARRNKTRCPELHAVTISIEYKLDSMKPREFVRTYENVRQVRRILLKGQLFQPASSQLLLDYLTDQTKYNRGTRFAPSMYKTDNDGRKELTLPAAAMIRHIVLDYNLSLNKMPALIQQFAVLLLGTTLNDDEFPSVTSIRRRILHLWLLDWAIFRDNFQSLITEIADDGFVRLWFSMSDDSKHFSINRHIVIMSALLKMTSHGSDVESIFKLVTASPSISKDSTGNALLNYKSFMLHLNLSIQAHYGGANSDTGADALLEQKKTFDLLMKELRLQNYCYGPINGSKLYGYERVRILMCDLFHVGNVMLNTNSVVTWGALVGTRSDGKGTYRQNHHGQLCQSLWDLFIRDTTRFKLVWSQVLNGCVEKDVRYLPKRWRPQRWNCNQKNCARQSILGYDLKVTWPSPEIDNRSFEVGDSALFAFAMHYATFQLSPTEKMIAENDEDLL